jgi:hypothetical protein
MKSVSIYPYLAIFLLGLSTSVVAQSEVPAQLPVDLISHELMQPLMPYDDDIGLLMAMSHRESSLIKKFVTKILNNTLSVQDINARNANLILYVVDTYRQPSWAKASYRIAVPKQLDNERLICDIKLKDNKNTILTLLLQREQARWLIFSVDFHYNEPKTDR